MFKTQLGKWRKVITDNIAVRLEGDKVLKSPIESACSAEKATEWSATVVRKLLQGDK